MTQNVRSALYVGDREVLGLDEDLLLRRVVMLGLGLCEPNSLLQHLEEHLVLSLLSALELPQAHPAPFPLCTNLSGQITVPHK